MKKALYIFFSLIGALLLYVLLAYIFHLIPLDISYVAAQCPAHVDPINCVDALGTLVTFFGSPIDINLGAFLKILILFLPVLITIIIEVLVIIKIIRLGKKKNSKKVGNASPKNK